MNYKRKNYKNIGNSNKTNTLNNVTKFKNSKKYSLKYNDKKVDKDNFLLQKYNYKNSIYTINNPIKDDFNLNILRKNIFDKLIQEEIENIKKDNIDNIYKTKRDKYNKIIKSKRTIDNFKLDISDETVNTDVYSEIINNNNISKLYKTKSKQKNIKHIANNKKLSYIYSSTKKEDLKIGLEKQILKDNKKNNNIILNQKNKQACNLSKMIDKTNDLEKSVIKNKTNMVRKVSNTHKKRKNKHKNINSRYIKSPNYNYDKSSLILNKVDTNDVIKSNGKELFNTADIKTNISYTSMVKGKLSHSIIKDKTNIVDKVSNTHKKRKNKFKNINRNFNNRYIKPQNDNYLEDYDYSLKNLIIDKAIKNKSSYITKNQYENLPNNINSTIKIIDKDINNLIIKPANYTYKKNKITNRKPLKEDIKEKKYNSFPNDNCTENIETNIINSNSKDNDILIRYTKFLMLTRKANILERYKILTNTNNNYIENFAKDKNQICTNDLKNFNKVFLKAINTNTNVADIIEKNSSLMIGKKHSYSQVKKDYDIKNLKSKEIKILDLPCTKNTNYSYYSSCFNQTILPKIFSYSSEEKVLTSCYKSKVIDSSSKNMIINNLKKQLNLLQKKGNHHINSINTTDLIKLETTHINFNETELSNLESKFNEVYPNNFSIDFNFKPNSTLSKILLQNKNSITSSNNNVFKLENNSEKIVSTKIETKIINEDIEKYNNKFKNKKIYDNFKSKEIKVQKNTTTPNNDLENNFKTLVISPDTKYKLGDSKFNKIKNKNLSRNIALIKFKYLNPIIRFKEKPTNIDFNNYYNGAISLDTERTESNLRILNPKKLLNSIFINSMDYIIEDKNNLGNETIIKTKNAINKTSITLKKSKTTKRIINNTTKKTIKLAQEATTKAINTARTMTKILSNPIVLKGLGVTLFIIIICISIALLTSSALSFVSSIVPFTATPIVKENTLNNLKNQISSLDKSVNNKIENLKNSTNYDDIVYKYNNDNSSLYTNIQDFLVILAIYTNQNVDDITISQLKEIHSLTYNLTTETQTFYCDEMNCQMNIYEDGTVIEYCNGEHLRLIITLTTYTFDELMTKLNFDDKQKEWAYLMAKNDIVNFYPNVSLDDFPSNDRLNDKQIEELLKNAPTVSTSRRTIVETAGQLLGYTTYEWGAKSKHTGGMPKKLDCSGFVDWVYRTAGIGNMLNGGGTSYQWGATYAIKENELEIGDLAFKQLPSQTTKNNSNHVGIYIGKDGNGKNLYIHCEYPTGVVINSYSGFKHFRRVPVNFN